MEITSHKNKLWAIQIDRKPSWCSVMLAAFENDRMPPELLSKLPFRLWPSLCRSSKKTGGSRSNSVKKSGDRPLKTRESEKVNNHKRTQKKIGLRVCDLHVCALTASETQWHVWSSGMSLDRKPLRSNYTPRHSKSSPTRRSTSLKHFEEWDDQKDAHPNNGSLTFCRSTSAVCSVCLDHNCV